VSGPTYVLIHGAWAGKWSWRDLGPELERRSLAWTSLDLPSSHDESGGATLGVDADAVVATASELGPIVLVGHSYGGAVAAEAASRLPDLESIVFVAAIVPEVGESATEVARRSPERTLLDRSIVVDGTLLRLDPSQAGAALGGRCSATTREWMVSQLGTQTLASFRAPRVAPDPSVPRRYVVCADDRAVHPALQMSLAERCDEWVSLDTDHQPMLSDPVRLAELLAVSDTGI
jgi:pimeloyl-ACP methyl ester carboxylesterase